MLYLLIAVATACFIIERIWTGWTLPRVRTWPVGLLAVALPTHAARASSQDERLERELTRPPRSDVERVERELMTYPLSMAKLEAALKTMQTLKAHERDPDVAAFIADSAGLSDTEHVPLAPRVAALAEQSPTVVAAARANGLTPKDYVYTYFALAYTQFGTTPENRALLEKNTRRVGEIWAAIESARPVRAR